VCFRWLNAMVCIDLAQVSGYEMGSLIASRNRSQTYGEANIAHGAVAVQMSSHHVSTCFLMEIGSR
jgi:hypothetical protein